jgi:hypothetical protein
MTVHKLYCDSRARKEGTHSDWVWQPDRPIGITEKARAFIDSVHLPVVWETITETNKYLYATETLPFLTVLNSTNKLYLLENGTNQRTISLDPAIYDGAALRANLAAKLSASGSLASSWSVDYITDGTTLGSMQIEAVGLTSWKLVSRREMIGLDSWGGITLNKLALNDTYDIFGLVESSVTAATSHTFALSSAKGYRQIALDKGFYTFDELASQLQTKINSNSAITGGSYAVTAQTLTGRLKVENSSTYQVFEIYPEAYLEKNAYMFLGVGTEPYSSDDVTGLAGDHVLQGNTITASMHVNVLRYHTLFITSDLGTHADSVGPIGQSTVCRKIVIDQPAGGFVNDFHSLPYDYVSLDQRNIAAIRFRLTDWKGRTVDMPAAWSLSVIIVPESDFV